MSNDSRSPLTVPEIAAGLLKVSEEVKELRWMIEDTRRHLTFDMTPPELEIPDGECDELLEEGRTLPKPLSDDL